jgi:Secretion system C-terminal sorting domain/FG-GAP-like repeat
LKNLIIITIHIFTFCFSQFYLKEVAHINAGTIGSGAGYILCSDTDNNGLNELIFKRNQNGYITLQDWEYRPINHYELVWYAEGGQPPQGEILVGNFAPNDIGDIDRDSLPDLVGLNLEDTNPLNKTTWFLSSTQESPDSISYPESLSWYYRCAIQDNGSSYYFTDDLDGDGRKEIMKAVPSLELGHTIWENTGNNQNQVVWNCTTRVADGFNYAFGDFDLDGKKEFITAGLGSSGRVSVFENTGPDSYELIYQDTVHLPNGSDVFSGNDLDGDGKPEFLVSFAQNAGLFDFYLYMWETTGNNTYERTLISTLSASDYWSRRSKCGDIDGDGIEEIVWSIGSKVEIYKATGNNQFQWLWEWVHPYVACSEVNIYDMNQNGYNEIVITGWDDTWLYEIEAVRLIRPNGGQNYLPGDSVLIKWRKFTPPRCDSFSLSYTTDNGQTYLPILNSISSTESTYYWIVPNTPSESCRVKVTAYGPGTQFDESDALFTIQPLGLEETSLDIQPLKLEIKPNPFKTQTAIRLNHPANKPMTIKIYNSSGVLVRTLTINQKQSAIFWNGKNEQGRASPNGIYLLKIESDDLKSIEKLIITR